MHTTHPLVSVSTILTASERVRLDAAGAGAYRALHRDGIPEIVRDIKANRANVVVVSLARCGRSMQSGLSAMVREFPSIATVALFSKAAPDDPSVAMSLGTSGIKELIDVRDPAGWNELRRVLLAERGGDVEREALSQLAIDLAGAEPDCWRFFERIFSASPKLCTVRSLSQEFGVLPTTLTSRFFRAGLPAPKRYLAMARLVRAARLFENPGFSIANVSNHLEYSSPQSFGRHVRAILRMSAGEFRRRFDGPAMLRHYRETLVLPHVLELRRLRPLGAVPISKRRTRAMH